MRRAILLLTLGLSGLASAQTQPGMDTVLTAKRALVLGPPIMVAGQNVVGLSISPDGRYIAAMRSVPSLAPVSIERPPLGPVRRELLVWDSVTGESRTVPMPLDLQDGLNIDWFPGSSRAVVSVLFPFYSEETGPNGQKWIQGYGVRGWILDPLSGRLHLLAEDKEPQARGWSVNISPTQPYGVMVTDASHVPGVRRQAVGGATIPVDPLVTRPSEPITLRVVTADGRLGTEVKLPPAYVMTGANGWTQDGREFLVEMRKVPEKGGETIEGRRVAVPCILHFNPVDGTYYDTEGAMAQYEAPVEESDVVLEQKTAEVESDGVKARVKSWWLRSKDQSDRPAAMVVGDAQGTLLAPNEKYLAYLSGMSVYVRQIIEIPSEQYLQMIAASKRAMLISNAKQVALAAMMYAGDHDDLIPSGLDPMQDLMPYLKNATLLEGFVMVFPGGRLTDLKDPGGTVLGYFAGPGGRAVAYIDGHVKWVPNEG